MRDGRMLHISLQSQCRLQLKGKHHPLHCWQAKPEPAAATLTSTRHTQEISLPLGGPELSDLAAAEYLGRYPLL